MDGAWGHYAKWNKSDGERQIPYHLTYIVESKTKNKQKIITEDRLVVARDEGWRVGKMKGVKMYKPPVIK